VPAALARGVALDAAPPGRARDLIRAPAEDLFRESRLLSISARRTITSFGEGDVPRDAIEEAVAAAFTGPSPHRVRPWRFTALETPAAKRALLGATAEARRMDLLGSGVDEATVGRRLDRSDAELGTARTLIVPWVRFEGPAAHADADRAHAERELSLLSAGAAIQ